MALNLNLSSTFDLLKCPETSLGSQCGQLSRLLEHIVTVCVGALCQTSRTMFMPLWCMYVAQYFNLTAFLKNSPWALRDYNHGLGSPLEFPISKYFSQLKYLYFRLFPPWAEMWHFLTVNLPFASLVSPVSCPWDTLLVDLLWDSRT